MSDNTQEQSPSLDDIADMGYVRQKRKKIIEALAPNDVIPTGDLKQVAALNQTLDSMERGALTRARLKQEEKKTQNEGAAAALIAQVLLGISNKAGQITVPEGTSMPSAPSLPKDIQTREYVPGEMDQGTVDVDYKKFVQE